MEAGFDRFNSHVRLPAGELRISAISETEQKQILLLSIRLPRADEIEYGHVPSIDLGGLGGEKGHDQKLVLSALVRSGVRHPGLSDLDLAAIHHVARSEGHLELFVDLNALTTGLAQQLVTSLRGRCARLVVPSSVIDVLHEYQRPLKKGAREPLLRRAELTRCLAMLEELRAVTPVHVHQLPPGTSSYMRRARSRSAPEGDASDEVTYVSEDRQLVGAFWHYMSTTSPRMPVRLVTSDFSLAHVCAAERVRFVFAPAPFEVWRDQLAVPGSVKPEAAWLDPFSPSLQATTAQRILWELALVYQNLLVEVDGDGQAATPASPEKPPLHDTDFALEYNAKAHLPGTAPTVSVGAPASQKRPESRAGSSATKVTQRRIKLSLTSVFQVVPTRDGQTVPLSEFPSDSQDSLRQLELIGAATGLYEVESDVVSAGPRLNELLKALQARDYVKVNGIFRAVHSYDEVLELVAKGGKFPPSKKTGAMTGWAIILGAAYKTGAGALFGLADVTEERFEQAVTRAHAALGGGNQAIPLNAVLDRVCRSAQISPIRFEALLAHTIGLRGLQQFEVQRATVRNGIPKHPVLVAPTSASPASYMRQMDPSKGLTIGNRTVSSLVRRGEPRR